MNKETRKKVRLIVRAFLCANKGKSYTSKELCEFVNSNGFGVGDGVMSAEMGRALNGNYCQRHNIDRARSSGRNVWHYKVVN